MKEEAGTLSDQNVAALREIADEDAGNVLGRNWTRMAALYTPEAVRMPPNAPAIKGREAILESLEAMPPVKAFSFDMLALEGDGEIAYMHAAWSITAEPPGMDEPFSDSGKILVVFRKQSDGKWLRVADAWNSDHPISA